MASKCTLTINFLNHLPTIPLEFTEFLYVRFCDFPGFSRFWLNILQFLLPRFSISFVLLKRVFS